MSKDVTDYIKKNFRVSLYRPMNKKKEITIRDLARMSGFSVATVSRSLNDSPLVKKKTKEKILRIADEVGCEHSQAEDAPPPHGMLSAELSL